LYFAILTKKALPDCQIIYERNKTDDSFRVWSCFQTNSRRIFSKGPKSHQFNSESFAYWDDLDVTRDWQKWLELLETDFVVVPEKSC
jgi:anthraniloyl-CoA monooxygenase